MDDGFARHDIHIALDVSRCSKELPALILCHYIHRYQVSQPPSYLISASNQTCAILPLREVFPHVSPSEEFEIVEIIED